MMHEDTNASVPFPKGAVWRGRRAGREDGLLSCLLKLEACHVRILDIGLSMAGVKGDIWK